MVSTVEKIGRYEIVSELGRGAMGLVYRAVDPNIGRTVALKTMRLDVHGIEHEDMLRRFKNEARAAGLMNHSNIVTIYDADETEGLFYIAMEYLEGETLQSLKAEKRILDAARIVEVGKQVCAGLDYAHSRKVIHRDIKPANIMITQQNVAKIMDFGIAKAVGTMTNSGQVLGTPHYMSPEQVKGLELDGRADLFSFGVVLYEMATGERPFAGDSLTTIIYKIVHESPIPPSEREATVHPGLSSVITRCLAKNPSDRYQTGAALALDLENYRSFASNASVTCVIPADLQVQATMAASTAGANRAAPAARAGSTAGPAAAVARTSSAVENAAVVQRTEKQTADARPGATAAAGKDRVAIVVLSALCVVLALTTIYTIKGRSQSAAATRQPQPAAPTDQPTPPPTVPAPQTQTTMSPSATQPTEGPNSKQGASATSGPEAALQAKSADLETKKVPPRAKFPQRPLASANRNPTLPSSAPNPVAAGVAKLAIRFNSNPPGAVIQVDGRSNLAWITPFTIADLSPGTHEVVVSKPGYTMETRTLEIGPKSETYTIELVPATTAVLVSSDPAGAAIEIDGRDTGKLTPAQMPVSEGQHSIVARKDGYHLAQVETNVKPGQIQSVALTLARTEVHPAGNRNPVTSRLGSVAKLGKIFGGGARGGKGVIDFVTTPPGAKIFVDGKAAKAATPAHAQFEPGDYEIELTEPGYKPVKQMVHVEAGKVVKVSVPLVPQ